jgi:large subunit ribosomal protein L21e
MVRASRGFRSGTRRKLSKNFREKFKPSTFLREFLPEDRVLIHQDPSSQKGMPHMRFRGKIGEVLEKRGESYVISVKLGKKGMKVISRPEHLRPRANNKVVA